MTQGISAALAWGRGRGLLDLAPIAAAWAAAMTIVVDQLDADHVKAAFFWFSSVASRW